MLRKYFSQSKNIFENRMYFSIDYRFNDIWLIEESDTFNKYQVILTVDICRPTNERKMVVTHEKMAHLLI